MGKINFTPQHLSRMKDLAFDFLIGDTTFIGSMGTTYNVVDLLHHLTTNSLLSMKNSIKAKIGNLESQDEWSMTDSEQAKISMLKEKEEFVNLIIGYKKYTLELAEIEAKKAALKAKIDALKESQKTPDDKIKELEAELNNL